MLEEATSNANPLTCPFCGSSPPGDFGRNSARCGACGGVPGGEFVEVPRRIVALPNEPGRHACGCVHPAMRLLPDEVYRCPACGSEVVPVSAGSATWKSPDHSGAYRSGWLGGRYGQPKPMLASLRLARWSSVPDRLDYYRGHRAGREARFARGRLLEAS